MPTSTTHTARPAVTIIGCGRRDRRDDQAGLLVARALAAPRPRGARIIESESPGVDLLLELDRVDLLIIVDAAAPSGRLPPGAIVRLCADLESTDDGDLPWRTDDPGPSDGRAVTLAAPVPAPSSHTLSLTDALGAARELDLLPAEVWLYVIGAADFGYGVEPSAPVVAAIETCAARIRRDVARRTSAAPDPRLPTGGPRRA